MLRSILGKAHKGKIALSQDTLSQLGIGYNGHSELHGAFCPWEDSIILSPIPENYWDKAIKIIIHAKDMIGAASKVMGVISPTKAENEDQFNVISSWISNESSSAHGCITSIVIPVLKMDSIGKEIKIEIDEEYLERIRKDLADKLVKLNVLTDIPVFNKESDDVSKSDSLKASLDKSKLLSAVRVTKLSILAAYREVIEGHFSQVNVRRFHIDLVSQNKEENLWDKIENLGGKNATIPCFLTTDTEEALIRITPLNYKAKLKRLSLTLTITSTSDHFSGYWEKALELLAESQYAIYTASNLLVEKTVLKDDLSENPILEANELTNNVSESSIANLSVKKIIYRETALFEFLLDIRASQHRNYNNIKLATIWKDYFTNKFKPVDEDNGSRSQAKAVSVRNPKGVGIPCFFSSNAKRKENPENPNDVHKSYEFCAKICEVLEGYGFLPVNIDIAKGGDKLYDQVLGLVKACKFMVVVRCPENHLEVKEAVANQKYRTSDWVQFEESAMLAVHGSHSNIIRLRYEQVIQPSYSPGYTETVIPEDVFTELCKDPLDVLDNENTDLPFLNDFKSRVDRWLELSVTMHENNTLSSERSDELTNKHLIEYYRNC